jgi:hypothetical protein
MKAYSAPTGLRPPPARAPARLRSTADLRSLQRLMTRALVRPLTARDGLQPLWIDGRPMADVAASFIKANSRLTAFERLQIYNRVYWYRLMSCFEDDNPGLRALLGERRFRDLARAYLARYPSRSFTLRNLCSRLPRFIREEPRWTEPRTAPALALARFAWAQTVAFDGEAHPVLTADDIADSPPARLRVGLQPYLSLLELDYAVDDFVIAVKKRDALRAEASNTVESSAKGSRRRHARPAARLRRGRIHLAVHRLDGVLYYKRLDRAELRILEALAAGSTVARAAAAGGRRVPPGRVRDWFASWMKFGWLCKHQKSK